MDDRTDLKIELIDISESEIMALAQFVKRSGFGEYRACAVDDDEAFRISHAVGKLRQALADVGYAPR